MMSDFEKQPEKINLKEIWFKILSNWKLFSVIFVIVITSTYLYLRYTIPMYEASIKIIIKDDENTTSGLSETSAFEDLKKMNTLETDENEVRITPEGLLRVDELLPAFYDDKYRESRYT